MTFEEKINVLKMIAGCNQVCQPGFMMVHVSDKHIVESFKIFKELFNDLIPNHISLSAGYALKGGMILIDCHGNEYTEISDLTKYGVGIDEIARALLEYYNIK